MIIIDKETGREFELLHVSDEETTHHIYGAGIAEGSANNNAGWPLRLILHQHTFGTVVFEETGEVRPPLQGEWFLWDKEARYVYMDNLTKVERILRPVAIE